MEVVPDSYGLSEENGLNESESFGSGLIGVRRSHWVCKFPEKLSDYVIKGKYKHGIESL